MAESLNIDELFGGLVHADEGHRNVQAIAVCERRFVVDVYFAEEGLEFQKKRREPVRHVHKENRRDEGREGLPRPGTGLGIALEGAGVRIGLKPPGPLEGDAWEEL